MKKNSFTHGIFVGVVVEKRPPFLGERERKREKKSIPFQENSRRAKKFYVAKKTGELRRSTVDVRYIDVLTFLNTFYWVQ